MSNINNFYYQLQGPRLTRDINFIIVNFSQVSSAQKFDKSGGFAHRREAAAFAVASAASRSQT